MADRPQPADVADHQLRLRLDDRLGEFRRDGDVFEQQRLRERGLLLGHDHAGGDVATNYDNSLGKLSQASYIPNPGNGTNQTGDTPQEVLFIVTDGVEDEQNGGRLQQAINDLGNAPGGNSSGTNWCTTIKNRGIKIAILYTEYLPVTANSWYKTYIAPIQSDIGPALQACASPGLFYDAAIGADLGQALTALFQAVVQNGHLTN